MAELAADLARRLAQDAEAVCRHYLPNGHREGRYWLVGDVENSPGRSLHVRLRGPEHGRGAAGKWTDEATGEHGDLLDLIAANQRLTKLHDTLDEARRFLSLPQTEPRPATLPPAPTGSPEAARRLFAISKPLWGTVAETYLRARGITDLRYCTSLRFHPRCFYRADGDDLPGTRDAWPAMIAAVTDRNGEVTGAHRTWLHPSGRGKAPVATPRRAMGHLVGGGVRLGRSDGALAAGEGLETMLSLRCVLPRLPMVAALSANHLAAFDLPTDLDRLYIARDNDAAGLRAAETLAERATAVGIEALMLHPVRGDFNEDLQRLGADELRSGLRVQLAMQDVARFMVGV